MTVALNTSLSSFGPKDAKLESEPGQDVPRSHESFEKLFQEEFTHGSKQETMETNETPAAPISPNETIDLQAVDSANLIAHDLSIPANTETPQILAVNFIPPTESELTGGAPIAADNSVPTEEPILGVLEAVTLTPIDADYDNAMGHVDPAVFAALANGQLPSAVAENSAIENVPAQTSKIPQTVQLTPGIPDAQTSSNMAVALPATGEAAQQAALAASELSLRDAKSPTGDVFVNRQIEVPKDSSQRPETTQYRIDLGAENFIKSSSAAQAIGSFEIASSAPDVTTPVLSTAASQSSPVQNILSAPANVNALASANTVPPALQIVSDNLIKALVSQSGVLMRLDPPEMGNVQINFKFDSERGVTAVIRSELADTSSFLRDRAEHLQQALKDSGFDSVSLSFEQGSQFNQQENSNDEAYRETQFLLGEDQGSKTATIYQRAERSNLVVRGEPVDMKL